MKKATFGMISVSCLFLVFSSWHQAGGEDFVHKIEHPVTGYIPLTDEVFLASLKARHGVIEKVIGQYTKNFQHKHSQPVLSGIVRALSEVEVHLELKSGKKRVLIGASARARFDDTDMLGRAIELNKKGNLFRFAESQEREKELLSLLSGLQAKGKNGGRSKDTIHDGLEAYREISQVIRALKSVGLNETVLRLWPKDDGIEEMEDLVNLGAAVHYLNSAIELDPTYYKLYYSRGTLISEELGELERALADYDRVIELNASCGEAYNARAMVKYLLERGEGALKDASKACELGVCVTLELLKSEEGGDKEAL